MGTKHVLHIIYVKRLAERVDEKHGVICLVATFNQIYGHYNIKNGPFFVFCAGDSQKIFTVWANYFSASERSYLALAENVMNCWILSYHEQDDNP